jgi:RNA polymerase sigma-70 factor (ECF subfamily)
MRPGRPGDGSGSFDADALRRRAEELRPYLRQLAALICVGYPNSEVDPSSVVQDALLAALKNLGQFDGKDQQAFQAWLVAIVRNTARKRLRHIRRAKRDFRRQRPLGLPSPLAGEGPGVRGMQMSAGSSSSPSALAIQREQAARVTATLEELTSDHRQIIQLRIFQGLAYQEIAEQLGRSPDALRQLLCRAIQEFKGKWKEE